MKISLWDFMRKAYEAQKALGLKLNMARGKPGTEQLDMVTREMAQLTLSLIHI